MADIETTWWEDTGRLTEREPTAGGGWVQRRIFKCLSTGEEANSKTLPVGALLALEVDGCYRVGADGLPVVCVLPGGTWWHIDERASNCTMPDDDIHRCWVRHGTVGDRLHVDKNGNTCAAGAGSIAIPGYHGFLYNGKLTNV